MSSEIRKREVKYPSIRGMAGGTSKVKNPWESRVQLVVNSRVVDILEGGHSLLRLNLVHAICWFRRAVLGIASKSKS